MIPYGRQNISDIDIQAVVEVLKSDYLTQGPVVPAFEQAVAEYCGCDFSVAVNSATSALHIACMALGVQKGDIVWTSPITFVASANCALYCGASIDFVDIDPITYNLSTASLEQKLVSAKSTGKLPKVVIPVHLSGQPCDMAGIFELSCEYGFSIIEDASHAIGGVYREDKIGNCKYSDITIFSFHPVKIITSAEGGMALTNRKELASKMRLLRSHGITRDSTQMINEPDGPWYYEQILLGYNYRMTDIQAALGLSQLQRLDEFIKIRHRIAKYYNEKLSGHSIVMPWQDPDNYSAMHLYIIRLVIPELKIAHAEIYQKLISSGIGVNLHYIPVYLQPYYQQLGFKKGYCIEAEKYYSDAMSLPIYPGLAEEEQRNVINVLISTIQPSYD